MAFEDYHDSFADSSEVRLLLFQTRDGLLKWAYTSAAEPVEIEGITYVPEAFQVSGLKKNASGNDDAVTVQLPFDNPVVLMHMPYLPTQPIQVTVSGYQRRDAVAEVREAFDGIVAGFGTRDSVAELSCVPVDAMAQQVPWMTQKAGCVLATYSGRCGVNMEDFATPVGAITSFAATTIQAAAFATKPDNWFRGGFIKNAANGDMRFITDHVGDTIKVIYPLTDMALDLVLTAYAGDDHTPETCHNKFNNKVNYLGFDHAPTYNVFVDGTGRGSLGGGPGGSGSPGNGDGFPVGQIDIDIINLLDQTDAQ